MILGRTSSKGEFNDDHSAVSLNKTELNYTRGQDRNWVIGAAALSAVSLCSSLKDEGQGVLLRICLRCTLSNTRIKQSKSI